MPAENMSRRAALGLASSVAAAAALPLRGARAATSPWTGEGFVSCPGMQIHYAILGEGPPLVLLHKLGGWIADWRHVAPALARHHRVIAFDSPGHGDSVVQGKVPYLLSLPESAAILLSVLDELGIERFSLVGNSLGGCIGVCMAALWPARIERLGLLSVALYPVIPRAALDGLEPAGTWGPNDAPLPRPFAEQQKRFGMKDIAIYDEQVASRAKAGPWVRAAQRGVAAGGVIDYLARVTAPTLLMYGERGSDYQQYEKPGLATAKHARSVHIPDAGAFAQMDNPRATEEIILEFLAEP